MASQAINARIIFMDAGQGDATLIVRPDGGLILIDCGSKKNRSTVKKSINEVLKDVDAKKNGLIALIITHPDEDHYNMISELIVKPGIAIGQVYYGGSSSHYGTLKNWLEDAKTVAKTVKLGDKHFDTNLTALGCAGMEIRVVAANSVNKDRESVKNENSVVVSVICAGTQFLLMGDGTKETEDFIMDQDKARGGALAALVKANATVL